MAAEPFVLVRNSSRQRLPGFPRRRSVAATGAGVHVRSTRCHNATPSSGAAAKAARDRDSRLRSFVTSSQRPKRQPRSQGSSGIPYRGRSGTVPPTAVPSRRRFHAAGRRSLTRGANLWRTRRPSGFDHVQTGPRDRETVRQDNRFDGCCNTSFASASRRPVHSNRHARRRLDLDSNLHAHFHASLQS